MVQVSNKSNDQNGSPISPAKLFDKLEDDVKDLDIHKGKSSIFQMPSNSNNRLLTSEDKALGVKIGGMRQTAYSDSHKEMIKKMIVTSPEKHSKFEKKEN
jgi:hypothetical protein